MCAKYTVHATPQGDLTSTVSIKKAYNIQYNLGSKVDLKRTIIDYDSWLSEEYN